MKIFHRKKNALSLPEDEPTRPRQITRTQLKRMKPEDVLKAYRDGQLSDLVNGRGPWSQLIDDLEKRVARMEKVAHWHDKQPRSLIP